MLFENYYRDPQARGSDVPSTICKEKTNCVTMVEDLKIG